MGGADGGPPPRADVEHGGGNRRQDPRGYVSDTELPRAISTVGSRARESPSSHPLGVQIYFTGRYRSGLVEIAAAAFSRFPRRCRFPQGFGYQVGDARLRLQLAGHAQKRSGLGEDFVLREHRAPDDDVYESRLVFERYEDHALRRRRALAVDDEVKIVGKVASVEEIKELI